MLVIKINDKIRNKYSKGLDREGEEISTLVLHGTAGGATLRYMINNVKRKYRYKKAIGLFHYYIKRNGEVIEIIDPKYWTYHSHANKFDKHTIGIELSNYNFKNKGTYTDAQYESLRELCRYLIDIKPTINAIVSHSHLYHKLVSSKPKKPECPGSAFDWERFKCDLELMMIEYKYNNQTFFDIQKNDD